LCNATNGRKIVGSTARLGYGENAMRTIKGLRVWGFVWLALCLTPAWAHAAVVGTGTVAWIEWQGQPTAKDFTLANGDAVIGGHAVYSPKETTQWVKLGQKYNAILVNNAENHSQVFVLFAGTGQEHPPIDTTLDRISAIAQDVKPHGQPLREGDSVIISTQPEANGALKVTVEFHRHGDVEPHAAFSFVQKK
jgi:hypothetical protein